MGAPVTPPVQSWGKQPMGALKKEYTALGYKAARVERRSAGARPHGGSEDLHLRPDRELLIRIADRFMRDNGIYKGILNRFVDAVLGARGFTLDTDYGKRANALVAARWDRFKAAPEVRGMFTWTTAERIALQSLANHGDVAAIHTQRRLFQFVEAEQIGGRSNLSGTSRGRGEHWESGVLLDKFGKPLAYRIHERSPSGHVKSGRGRRIPAKNITFMANRERFSQTRGVPILVSIFSMVNRISDVCDAEAVAWQNLAKFALTVTRDGSPDLAYGESVPDFDGVDPASSSSGSSSGSVESDADLANRVMELEEGILFFGNKGETIAGIDRKLPGKDFPESVRMFLRLIGMPLGIPLEVILLDYSQTNYTSARASLEQAYRMFQVWQNFLKDAWHTPLFRRWLQWETNAGTLPKSPRIMATIDGSDQFHHWNASEFPWIDHLKEAEAWGMRMDRGLATQSMALKSINMDHDKWAVQREAEVKDAIERADRLNKANPEAHVDWRMFAAMPVSKSQGVAAGAPAQQAEPAQPAAATPPPPPAAPTQNDRGHLVAQLQATEAPVPAPDPSQKIAMPPIEITMQPAITVNVERVDAGEVIAGAVTAGDVQAGEVQAGDVNAGDVQATGAVTAGDVAAGAVQAGDVRAGAVTAEGGVTAQGGVTTGPVTVDATINMPERKAKRLRIERQGGPHGPIQEIIEEPGE